MALLDTLQGLTQFGLGAWSQVAAIQGAQKATKAVVSGQAAPIIIQTAAAQPTPTASYVESGPRPAAGLDSKTMLLIGAAVAGVFLLPKLMKGMA